MPVFLEPGQRYPVILSCDESKPAETRPTFYAKSQSMRGQQRIADTLDLWTSNNTITAAELFDATVETLSKVLVGWSNITNPETGKPIDYSPEAVRDVLTYSEARELLRLVMHNQHLQTEEKKSSESQP